MSDAAWLMGLGDKIDDAIEGFEDLADPFGWLKDLLDPGEAADELGLRERSEAWLTGRTSSIN
ncbi:MAG: hypothetical protein OEV40_25160 [Acidimicrobiia bacterium]|nr:hypothetical protein [Acidimicrobiia bacterium]